MDLVSVLQDRLSWTGIAPRAKRSLVLQSRSSRAHFWLLACSISSCTTRSEVRTTGHAETATEPAPRLTASVQHDHPISEEKPPLIPKAIDASNDSIARPSTSMPEQLPIGTLPPGSQERNLGQDTVYSQMFRFCLNESTSDILPFWV